jgi:hypothetical protein
MIRFNWHGVIAALVLGVILIAGASADAAKLVKVDEIRIEADKSVSPMDYSFSQKPLKGRLELGTLKNLYGNGAGFIIYIDMGEEGRKWLSFKMDTGSFSARIVGQSGGIISFQQSAITDQTPLILEIQNDVLSITAGKLTRTVKGVTSFSGGLTTQSIETTLKAYQWQDE